MSKIISSINKIKEKIKEWEAHSVLSKFPKVSQLHISLLVVC